MAEVSLKSITQRAERASSRVWAREAALHAALAMLVLAATWLGFNTDQLTRVGAIDTTPGVVTGVNAPEFSERGVYRWTDGATTICLPQAGRAPRSLVRVDLAGDYALALGTTGAILRPGNGPGVAIVLPAGLRRYTLLTEGNAHSGSDLCLSVLSTAVADPNNNRRLGVPIYGFVAQHLPLAGPVFPAPGQLVLNLALALTAFWLMRGLGVPTTVASALVLIGSLAPAIALMSGLVPAGVNPARLQIPVVGGVAGALLGLLVARRFQRLAPEWPRLAQILLGMLFWSLLLVSGFRTLQWANGHSSVWPLKAGIDPNPTWWVLVPAALFMVWVWVLLGQESANRGPRTENQEPSTKHQEPRTENQELSTKNQELSTKSAQSAVISPQSSVRNSLHRVMVPPSHHWAISLTLLLLGAIIIPVALEVTILGWDALYSVFRDSEYDYLRDTFRVGDDPLGFLRTYVDQAPQMALHTSTHPPGSVLFLWAVEQSISPGAVATSWAAIIFSSLIVLAAYWLGMRLGGPRIALLAGVITVAMPGQLIYNVTSMDGIFNAFNALGAVAFFLALEPPARVRTAILAGVLIALALFFTYATTQLAFFGLAAGAMALWRRPGWPTLRIVVRQGGVAAGVIVLIYLALYLFTGFDVIRGSREATAENAQVMGRWLYGQTEQPFAPPSFAYYLDFLGANIAPYLWYVAPWGLTAVSGMLLVAAARRWREAGVFEALLVAVGACVLGMALSGLFNREVERIWGFTYPLVAVLIAQQALQGDERSRRWWSLLYPTLFFVLGAAMKLTLDTVW
jgi:hypothetical protein